MVTMIFEYLCRVKRSIRQNRMVLLRVYRDSNSNYLPPKHTYTHPAGRCCLLRCNLLLVCHGTGIFSELMDIVILDGKSDMKH